MSKRVAVTLALLTTTAAAWGGSLTNSFTQTNLVSDLTGVAAHQDSNLSNPWGLVDSPTSPFWISNNNNDNSTLYNGTGQAIARGGHELVENIQPAAGNQPPVGPTGVVFNGNKGDFGGAAFIFATESGTINSFTSFPNAPAVASGSNGSIYKGLGINAAGGELYAANFGLNRIDVFDANFKPVTLAAGAFTDPNLPVGYSPFNIQNIDGSLYVTYDKKTGDNQATGNGVGFVDVYSLNGVLKGRVASQGVLDAPWGLAIAPANFGTFGGDLLVGNFGNGTINAFNLKNDTFAGTLDGANGKPIANPGLWALDFGNGALGEATNKLYFTAGIPGSSTDILESPTGTLESHGLFGDLSAGAGTAATPEPGPLSLTGFGFAALLLVGARNFFKRKTA